MLTSSITKAIYIYINFKISNFISSIMPKKKNLSEKEIQLGS